MDIVTQTLLSGGFAGFCSLVICVPLDLLKCRAQMTMDRRLNYREEVRHIWKN